MLDSDQQFIDADDRPMPGQLRTSPRRRRPGAMATLAGIVGGGVIGILLGAYGLLWILGPQGDVLGLGPRLPAALRPPGVGAPAAHGR